MSPIQEQVRRARRRLWFGLWLDVACRMLCWSAVAFGLAVIAVRLAGWSVPWLLVGGVLFGVALVASLIWSYRVRPSEATAAAALDDAVGLRERVSSSLWCTSSDDPFAQAVYADAEQRVQSLTVRRHLRLRWPQTTGWAVAALVFAAGAFLAPEGVFQSDKQERSAQQQAQVVQTRVQVKKRLDDIKKMAATNPALSDLKEEMEKLDLQAAEKMSRPEDVRNEAVKKLDRLADAVREKQQSEKFDKVSETKRMMRALEQPAGEQTPVQQLARDLKAGDFKSAQETIKKMQEQLATLKKDQDKEFVAKMQEQLEQLAKQMDKLADQEQLKKQLEQAGIKPEDVERMLERLSKEDLDQIRKQLEKSGMSQQQIEKLCQQCKKQQGASQAMKQMSQAMKSAAAAAGDGDMGGGMAGLEQAGEQLSEMEQLEQELKQLESAMASLNDAKSQCQGSGPGQGQGQGGGQGGGQGNQGQGRGGLAQRQQTGVGFKVERGEVETTKGKIVGQFLVDGEQVRGEATEEFVELIRAAERDATDTVNRNRIPRQYQKAVKDYFSRLPNEFGLLPAEADAPDGEGEEDAEAAADETAEAADESAPADDATEQ